MTREIANILLDLNAVKLSPNEPFTWTSGIQSPIYCDNRQILSDIKAHRQVIDHLKTTLLNGTDLNEIDVIAGTATAGIPHATLLADRLDRPSAYVRSSKKAHGTARQIEGADVEGKNVVLVEDLISTGGSSIKALEALKENGANVVTVLAIFTYGIEGVREKFADLGYNLEILLNLDELLECALDRATIDQSGVDIVKNFRDSL